MRPRFTATAIPPSSGGADVHGGEATHVTTITGGVAGRDTRSRVQDTLGLSLMVPIFGLVTVWLVVNLHQRRPAFKQDESSARPARPPAMIRGLSRRIVLRC